MNRQCGITLVELVITMMVVTALSVFVAPKILNSQTVNTSVLQKTIISKLREVQLLALNDNRHCYSLNFTHNDFQPVRYSRNVSSGVCDKSSAVFGNKDDIPLNTKVLFIGNPQNVATHNKQEFSLEFDNLGRIPKCEKTNCISLSGSELIYIIVEREGYIYGR